MTIVKNSKGTYVVEVKYVMKFSNSKGTFYRLNTKSVDFNSKYITFDAWDEHAKFVGNNVKEGDILVIEAVDYMWPTSGDITKKIYKIKNYTTSYEKEVVITNEKCTRGVKTKDFNCFCGKVSRQASKKFVSHFYYDKKLDSFIVKNKKCKVTGNIIRDINNKHTSILVDNICWL